MSLLFPLLALSASFAGPDPAPAMAAVQGCDLAAMQSLTKAEPRRRSTFASEAYAEQQAIVRERGVILARAATPLPEDGAALLLLDGRQRQLDGARSVEAGWRTMLEELRLDFLANCSGAKART